jgi:ferredoxin
MTWFSLKRGVSVTRAAAHSRSRCSTSIKAAAEKAPREGNVDGQFFVDSSCIDCDVCRWMAPQSFARVGSGSAVVEQPSDEAGRIAAMQATLSCPT